MLDDCLCSPLCRGIRLLACVEDCGDRSSAWWRGAGWEYLLVEEMAGRRCVGPDEEAEFKGEEVEEVEVCERSACF